MGPSGVLGPGVPMPKKHKRSRKEWFVGLAAEGGKAKNPFASGEYVVFGLCTPSLQKNTWTKNDLGIPLELQKVAGLGDLT